MTTRKLNIKNRSYNFYNALINIFNFEANNSKLDKKHDRVETFSTLVMFIKNLTVMSVV